MWRAPGRVGVRAATEAAAATLLHLPPHSPDLNPIEMVFAKMRAQLHAAAIRTVDALWQAVGTIALAVPAAEWAKHVRHYGYFQSV